MRTTTNRFMIIAAVILLLTAGCTIVDYPALVLLPVSSIPSTTTVPSFPDQVFRDGSSVGFSDYHRDYGYIKVTINFFKDSYQTVSIESFDALGQPRNDAADSPALQSAIGLGGRLRSLGPNRIAELDAISGATVTVNGIKQAAWRATAKARYRQDQEASIYYDGTFLGVTDRSLRGWTIAVVTIRRGVMEHVMLHGVFPQTEELEDGSTAELLDANGDFVYQVASADHPWPEYHQAVEILEQNFIAAGISGIDYVDSITRATVTSLEAKIAVSRALDAAKR